VPSLRCSPKETSEVATGTIEEEEEEVNREVDAVVKAEEEARAATVNLVTRATSSSSDQTRLAQRWE